MRPEQQIQQASRPARPADMPMRAPIRLDDVAVRLMAVQRHGNDADWAPRLSAALQASRAAWHSDHKIAACESDPSVETLGGLIARTRNLAGSFSEWREAA